MFDLIFRNNVCHYVYALFAGNSESNANDSDQRPEEIVLGEYKRTLFIQF
jgi:hypothetical protein